MLYASNPDIRLLETLLSNLRHIFPEKLVGLYLYGSLITGDFDPDISDIDLLVVTSSQISAAEFEALHAMHSEFARANPDWDSRIDAVYLSAESLREFRTEKSPIVISPAEPFHVREGEALKDWLQNWYIVREAGLALFGPPPQNIIPPISHVEFVEAVRRYAAEVSGWARHEPDRKGQAYAILTLCRVLHVLRTGKPVSKKEAALWAQQEFPEWSKLIQDTLAWRQDWREENIDHALTHAETRRFIDFANDQILS